MKLLLRVRISSPYNFVDNFEDRIEFWKWVRTRPNVVLDKLKIAAISIKEVFIEIKPFEEIDECHLEIALFFIDNDVKN